MEIKIDTIGKITSGDECGWYVKVLDDSENTGGFIVLTSERIDFSNAFDSWVESLDALQSYFEESQWTVKWNNMNI